MHLYDRCGTFFFFNDTATTEIYTLSLHDALPIFVELLRRFGSGDDSGHEATRACTIRSGGARALADSRGGEAVRSEEHTSELQSRQYLVCRLLLEKKKKIMQTINRFSSLQSTIAS